MFHNTIIAVKT